MRHVTDDLPPTPPGAPRTPPTPLMPPQPGSSGTSRLAIAALCLGIVGIVPPLGVVAVVLGAVALSRLGSRPQAGRGLAVAGIVLGSLAVLAWAVILAVVLLGGPQRDASGRVTEPGEVFVEELTAGDCFNGGRSNEVDVVTVVPCETEHESQVVTTFELPDGSFPGEQKVLSAAEAGCTDRADPRVRDDRYDDVELASIYPADEDAWAQNRTIACTIDAAAGRLTGSVLK